MAGVVIIIIVMVLALPVAIMLGGAVWSAVMGYVLVEDAEGEADAAPEKA